MRFKKYNNKIKFYKKIIYLKTVKNCKLKNKITIKVFLNKNKNKY